MPISVSSVVSAVHRYLPRKFRRSTVGIPAFEMVTDGHTSNGDLR
jgi:hypothetical protein